MKWTGDANIQYHLFNKESGAVAHDQIGNMSQAHAVILVKHLGIDIL